MFFVVKKKNLIQAFLLLIVFATCAVCLNFVNVNETVFAHSDKKLPVYRVDVGEEKKIAISFDAAWGADKTRRIVDLLTERNLKATFFLVGFWVDAYKEEVAYIADHGMEIGNHSRSHLHMSALSPDKLKAEVDFVNSAVRTITGITPRVFRAPFGEYDDRLISYVESIGMIPVQWDVDSLDWKGISGKEIAQRITSKVKNGSIILCHNNSDHILDALPTLLDDLVSRGFTFVTMSELLYPTDYFIDAQGVQHLNK